MPAAITPATDLTSIKLKQNERQRALAEALIGRAFRERPNAQQVGNGVVSNHWTNTLADVLSAGLGSYQARKLDEEERTLTKEQQERSLAALMTAMGAPAATPAATPAEAPTPIRPPMALPSMGGPPPSVPLQSPNPGPAPARVLPQQDINAVLNRPAAPAPGPTPSPGPMASPMPLSVPEAPATASAAPAGFDRESQIQETLAQFESEEARLAQLRQRYTMALYREPSLAAALEGPIKALAVETKALLDAKYKFMQDSSDPNWGFNYQTMNDQGFAMSGGRATPTVDARTVYSAPIQLDGGAIIQAEARPGGKVEPVLGYRPQGTNVRVSVTPEDKSRTALAEKIAGIVSEPLGLAIKRMDAASAQFRTLDTLDEINRTLTLSGPQANWGKAVLGFADGMGLPLSDSNRARLVNTQVYDSNISKQVFDEIEALGAARSMTNEDMKAFREIFANSTLSVAARQRIIDQTRTRAVNRMKQDQNLLDAYLMNPDIPEDQKMIIRQFRNQIVPATAADIMGGASDVQRRPR